MKKGCRSPNDELSVIRSLTHIEFRHSDLIRHSSFVIRHLHHFSVFFVASVPGVSATASTSTGASPFTRTVPTIRARSPLCSARSLSLNIAVVGFCGGG